MTVGHLLAWLLLAGIGLAVIRAIAWFFRGANHDDVLGDEPITGYSDPVRGGRMRW